MQHVLIVWELDGNLGHLSRLHLVARTLAAKGARVTFAVRDYEAAAPWLRARGWTCVMAPRTRISFWGRRRPAGHADWYLCEGFNSPANVQGLILETAVDPFLPLARPHGH